MKMGALALALVVAILMFVIMTQALIQWQRQQPRARGARPELASGTAPQSGFTLPKLPFLPQIHLPFLPHFQLPFGKRSTPSDPVEAMKLISDECPVETHFDKYTYHIANVSYDVRKTESMVNPIMGYLYFTSRQDDGDYSMKFEVAYQWEDTRWHFRKLTNLDSSPGLDYEHTEGGEALMSGDTMRPFFEKYGWREAVENPAIAAATPPPPPPTVPAPAPAQVYVPPPSPNQLPEDAAAAQARANAQRALEIARKYGGH